MQYNRTVDYSAAQYSEWHRAGYVNKFYPEDKCSHMLDILLVVLVTRLLF